MSKEYSPLKLIRNKVFPIYQLNAVIEEKKITKEEAFKICILETMVWIRQKFENLDIPDELNTVSPAMYKELDLKSLGSFRIERGYIVEVVDRVGLVGEAVVGIGAHAGGEFGNLLSVVLVFHGTII